MSKQSPWVVTDVKEDSSFATVSHTDVETEDPLLVGQVVKFFWNKKLFSGKVCMVDGKVYFYQRLCATAYYLPNGPSLRCLS